jgi:hypothetical protein
MDTKNFFKHGRKISAKLFRSNYRKSKPTQEYLRNERISQILNREPERNELNQKMYEKSKDGLSRQEMQETIGEMKTLTESEKRRLAKEIFPNLPSGQRIIKPKAKKPSVSAKIQRFSPKKKEASIISVDPQKNPVKMAMIMNRMKVNSNEDPEVIDSESDDKSSFSGALAATMRNKR